MAALHCRGKLVGRRTRIRRRGKDADPLVDDSELTEEILVLLRNVEHMKKSRQTGASAFKELGLENFVRLSSSQKCRIKKSAKEFLKNLRQGSREERRQFLTAPGAKYLIRTPENEDLAKELLLHELAMETITQSQIDSERVRNTLLTDQECLQFAAACSSSSSSSSYLHHQQHQQTNTSSFDNVASNFSHEVQEEYERGIQQVLLDDVLPRQIGRIQLTQAQLEILSRSENNAPKFSFRRLLSHYSMWKNEALMNITDLLKLLHVNKCEIDYKELPTTADGLLAISEELLKRTKIRIIYSPLTPGKPPEETAQYLSLGIEHALLGKSCGLVDKWNYFMTMRTVLALFPELIPREIRDAIGPQKGEEYDSGLLKNWYSLPPPDPSNEDRKLVLLIHGHIDGVQWYTNSTQSKGVPVLARLVGIRDETTGEGIKIPTLSPFVVGTLKLAKKTNTKDFVEDFVTELVRLGNPAKSGLSFKVQLVCMICDAPQRADCKGIVGHGGYYACERCITRGVKLPFPEKGATKFPELDARLRSDADWHKYIEPVRGEQEGKTHRKRNPIEGSMFEDKNGEVLYEFPHVAGFPLESMHLIDGGAFKQIHSAWEDLCNNAPVKHPSRPERVIKISIMPEIEDRVKFLNQFTLVEQARKLREFSSQNKWKMREHHVFFMYYLYHVMEPFANRLAFGIELLNLVKHLLLAMHCVKGFSAEPIPQERLDRARQHIRIFLEGWKPVFGVAGMTYKMHSLIHVLDDCENFQCHLEYLSSYPYENFHSKWKTWLRSGNKPLQQIRNRLCQMHQYLLPVRAEHRTNRAKNSVDFLKLTKDQIKYMQEYRTTELPPAMFLESRMGTKKGEKNEILELAFVGFTLKKTFSQNICLMRDGFIVFCNRFLPGISRRTNVSSTADDEANAIHEQEEVKPQIAGFKFGKVADVFTEPYNSRDIGLVQVSEIDIEDENTWGCEEVVTKCFIFPRDSKQKTLNPVPDDVIREIETSEGRRELYNAKLDMLDTVSWNVHTLIQPSDDVIAKMVTKVISPVVDAEEMDWN